MIQLRNLLNIPAMSLFKRGLGIGPLGPGGTTPSSLKNILYKYNHYLTNLPDFSQKSLLPHTIS